MREGNTTLLVGVDNDKLDDALDIVKESRHYREQLTPVFVLDVTWSNSFNPDAEWHLGKIGRPRVPPKAFKLDPRGHST